MYYKVVLWAIIVACQYCDWWKEIAFPSKEATEGTKISCYALDNLVRWQTNKYQWESVIHILY